MKVQAITTNYLTAVNKKSNVKQKGQAREASSLNFSGFPLLSERQGRFWKINGEEILKASKEQLKDWAEYLHKEEYLSSDIYTITKPHWWSGTKVDEFNTGIAYEKIRSAIERVREYKRTCSAAEKSRLDAKAEKCEDVLSEMRTYYVHTGSV